MEFSFAYRQYRLPEIDVVTFKVQRFAGSQPRGSHETNESRIGSGPQAVDWSQPKSFSNERTNFLMGIDIRLDSSMRTSEQPVRRNLSSRLKTCKVANKRAHYFKSAGARKLCALLSMRYPSEYRLGREGARATAEIDIPSKSLKLLSFRCQSISESATI